MVSQTELINQMIQRPAQVTDNITSSGQAVEGDVEGIGLAWNGFERLNVQLSSRSVVVECVKPSLHITEILFGPLNLRANESVSR
jgi:hypothetical protein